jgi:hypothetical protein
MLLIESGGDNLAANYSRELADYIIYVVSVVVFSLVFAFADIKGSQDGVEDDDE